MQAEQTEVKVAQRRKAEPLTEARVARAAPAAKRWVLADATVRGLVVRIEPTGLKSYFVRSRIGKGRAASWAEIRLGDAGQVRLSDARDEARGLLAVMRSGTDPRKPLPGSLAVSEVIDRYAARLEQRGVVKRQSAISSLERNLERYSRRPLGDLSRADVVSQIERIEADGRFGAADDFRKHCVAMLNWAVSAGLLMASPMAGYRRERTTRAQRISRPKVVFKSGKEIAQAWTAFEKMEDPCFGAFLKFLLLTGQRRTETAYAKWDNLVLAGRDPCWAIPAEVRKMGDAHRVPLGTVSCAMLLDLPRVNSGLIFPGRGGVAMSGWTQRLAKVKLALDQPAFAFHALRRTYRSGLSELGVPFEIAEMMIGHARPDLARRYDHATLWRQRCEAQALWETFVKETVVCN